MARQTVNGVTNFYGPRNRYEGMKGEQGRHNDLRQLVITFGGDTLGAVSFVLPKGSTIVGNALVEINEPFVLGGTDPTILVGKSGSAATDYIATITEAQAESAAGSTYSLASGGALAVNTPVTADTTITVSLGGTTPTAAAAGKLKLVVPYKLI